MAIITWAHDREYSDRSFLVAANLKFVRFPLLALALLAILGPTFSAASASPLLSKVAIAKTFDRISESPSLANPSIILIDRGSGEVIFEKNAQSPRKPASVLKLLSAMLALQYLDPNYQYETKIALGPTPRSLVLSGEFDPWMASRHKDAVANNRASLTSLGNKAIERLIPLEGGVPKTLSVKYNGVYLADIKALGNYFKNRGIKAYFSAVSSTQAESLSIEDIATVTSPSVLQIVQFAIRWSDNLLADRLAEDAAVATGYTRDISGVTEVAKALLTEFGIDSKELTIKDGSGLSKKNRMTAEMIADLLVRIREDDIFAPIYAGLPVSGISGTLEDRFTDTSPDAVGLIHAKTGTLDGTVALAGYVSAGEDEYIFVALADRIKKGTTATKSARITLDRLIGKLAFPIVLAS